MPPPSLIFIPQAPCSRDLAPSTTAEVEISPIDKKDAEKCVQDLFDLSKDHSSKIIADISTALEVDTKDAKLGLLRLVQVKYPDGSAPSIAFEYVSHDELAKDSSKYQELHPRCKILSLKVLLRNAEQDSDPPEAFKQYFQKKMAQDSSYSIFMHEPILCEKFLELRGTFAYPQFKSPQLHYYLRQIKLMDKTDAQLFLEQLHFFLKNHHDNLYLFLEKVPGSSDNIAFRLGNKSTYQNRSLRSEGQAELDLILLKAIIAQAKINYPLIDEFISLKIQEDPRSYNNPDYLRTYNYELAADTFAAFQFQTERFTPLIQEYQQRYNALSSTFLHGKNIHPEEVDMKIAIKKLEELKKEIQDRLPLADQMHHFGENFLNASIWDPMLVVNITKLLLDIRVFKDQANELLETQIRSLEKNALSQCIQGEIEATRKQMQNPTRTIKQWQEKMFGLKTTRDTQRVEQFEELDKISKSIEEMHKDLPSLKLRIENINILLKTYKSVSDVMPHDFEVAVHDLLASYQDLEKKFKCVSAEATDSLAEVKLRFENWIRESTSNLKQSCQRQHDQLTQDDKDILTTLDRSNLLKQLAEEMANDSIEDIDDAIIKAKEKLENLEILEKEAHRIHCGITKKQTVLKDCIQESKDLLSEAKKFTIGDYSSDLQSISSSINEEIARSSSLLEESKKLMVSVQEQKISVQATLKQLEELASIPKTSNQGTVTSSEEVIVFGLLVDVNKRIKDSELQLKETKQKLSEKAKQLDSETQNHRNENAQKDSLETGKELAEKRLNLLKLEQGRLEEEKRTAELAKRDAEEAKHTAKEAQRRAEEAKHTAELAQRAAQEDQSRAEEAKHTAELAKRDAETAQRETTQQLVGIESLNSEAISDMAYLRSRLNELAAENARLTAQSQQPPSLIQRFFDSIAGFFRRIFRRNPNRAQNNPVGGIEGRGLHATETPPAQAPNADPPPNYANHADFSSTPEMVPPPAYPESPPPAY